MLVGAEAGAIVVIVMWDAGAPVLRHGDGDNEAASVSGLFISYRAHDVAWAKSIIRPAY